MTAKRSSRSGKKTSSSRRSSSRSRSERPIKERLNERLNFQSRDVESTAREYKEALWEFMNKPGVKYFAGGLAAAVLARLASGISERYPEISKFIRENVENMETKLSEFRSEERGESESLHH